MEDLLKEYRDVSLKKINKEIYRVKGKLLFWKNLFQSLLSMIKLSQRKRS